MIGVIDTDLFIYKILIPALSGILGASFMSDHSWLDIIYYCSVSSSAPERRAEHSVLRYK